MFMIPVLHTGAGTPETKKTVTWDCRGALKAEMELCSGRTMGPFIVATIILVVTGNLCRIGLPTIRLAGLVLTATMAK